MGHTHDTHDTEEENEDDEEMTDRQKERKQARKRNHSQRTRYGEAAARTRVGGAGGTRKRLHSQGGRGTVALMACGKYVVCFVQGGVGVGVGVAIRIEEHITTIGHADVCVAS
jgi:hypothetical protein